MVQMEFICKQESAHSDKTGENSYNLEQKHLNVLGQIESKNKGG